MISIALKSLKETNFMKTLRTPEECFADLPGYNFAENYVNVSDTEGGQLRMHYLDEGPSEADPILLLHGEPSWSYLYRHMIPVLVAAGHRVVVPDLVGFGKSDKPSEKEDYTYARHITWVSELLFDSLDLSNITFFGQDWGGLIGLRLVAASPERFSRVVIGNTGLPTGDGPLSSAFMAWQKFSQESPHFDIGKIVGGGCVSDFSEGVTSAYNAPFPDDTYKAGARIFPSLVPTTPDNPESKNNQEAWEVLKRFEKPFLTCFSDSDPVTKGGESAFIGRVSGTENQQHVTIEDAGHFLQEDKGPELAEIINEFISRN